MANTSTGIVIKSINYSDSSKILYVLTKDGIDNILVKGARKIKSKMRPLCQLATLISYNKSKSKGLASVYTGDVENAYLEIKSDLEKTTYVFHIFEIIYKLSNEINFQVLYDFLIELLDEITNKDPEILSFIFELKFLYLIGLNPVFKHCVNCDKPETVGFDVYQGGVVCSEHVTEYTIRDVELIASLYRLYLHNISDSVDFSINKRMVRKILDEYYIFYMNFNGKSREVLLDIYGY